MFMWSSRKITAISIPSFAALLLASLKVSSIAFIPAAVLGIHLIFILIGFMRIKLRLCPKNTFIPFSDVSLGDRSLSVGIGRIYTRSRISSTVYLVRGYIAPKAFFLHPLLLCMLTYFKPLYIGSSQYLAFGSAPHFVYVLKSRIGSTISSEDEGEIYRVYAQICGE